MIKQYYNSGNKCFMLIDTDKKGGIVKASKKPFDEYPIENVEQFMEQDEETETEKAPAVKENSDWFEVETEEVLEGSEAEDNSNSSEWDSVFD